MHTDGSSTRYLSLVVEANKREDRSICIISISLSFTVVLHSYNMVHTHLHNVKNMFKIKIKLLRYFEC